MLARTVRRLRDDDLDARFPRRAAQRREIAARRAAVASEMELYFRERAEHGERVALERRRERTRVDTVARYREACERGRVSLHLAIAYWATEGPDALYWATVGTEDTPSVDDG